MGADFYKVPRATAVRILSAGRGCTQCHGAETPTLPCVTLHLAVHLCLFIIAFNKLVNVSASLNPVTFWSKLFKPMEGVIRTSDLQCVDQKHRWPPAVVTWCSLPEDELSGLESNPGSSLQTEEEAGLP